LELQTSGRPALAKLVKTSPLARLARTGLCYFEIGKIVKYSLTNKFSSLKQQKFVSAQDLHH
jgi:hypothetical protein